MANYRIGWLIISRMLENIKTKDVLLHKGDGGDDATCKLWNNYKLSSKLIWIKVFVS